MSFPQRSPRVARALIVVATAAALLGGCGSDDDDSGSTGGGTLDVTAKEFAFEPNALQSAAGDVRITLDNQGKFPHELVLLKTDKDEGALKSSAGKVTEKGLGEIRAIDGGASGSKTFKLTAGRFVMYCNVDGHYGKGMHGTLTVE